MVVSDSFDGDLHDANVERELRALDNGDAASDGEGGAGEEVDNAEVDDDAVTIVNVWPRVRLAGAHSEWVMTAHDPELIPTSDILDTVIYTPLHRGVAGVLLPCEFR